MDDELNKELYFRIRFVGEDKAIIKSVEYIENSDLTVANSDLTVASKGDRK